jgi:hypothetical protein
VLIRCGESSFGSCLLLLLLVSGCTRAGTEEAQANDPLNAGVWRGDVAPAGSAPFGAQFHIDGSGATIRLESMYLRQQFTDVAAARDSLRFTWPMDTPRRCLLLRRTDDSWQGTCHADERDPIGVLLVPPDRYDVPTGVARAAYESDISWIEERAGPLRVLVQAGGAAAAHAQQLRESAVAAFESAFALLEETPPDVPFWIIYVDSRLEMQRLVGRPAGGFADGVARAAANVATVDGRAPDRHEIMHVAAAVAWGVPAAPWAWINEGLATYAPRECAGAGLHSLAAALVEAGAAVPLDRLIHDFWNVDEVGAYVQSASLVGYIREAFGIGAVRAIWQEGHAALPEVTGTDIDSLERDWRAFVSSVQATPTALASVRTRGCLQFADATVPRHRQPSGSQEREEPEP